MTRELDPKRYRGLTNAQAEESIKLHGSNVLTPVKGKSAWRELLDKFRDPIIEILIVAWVLSMIVAGVQCWGEAQEGFDAFLEPIGIFFAIMIATLMSFFFERKANKEFSLLNQVNDDVEVTVVRDGIVTQVPRREVAVGDVVILNTGDEVPADGELIDAVGLQVNESSLTGEPVANKSVNPDADAEESTYPANEVFRGSNVVDGHGIMRVTAVGDNTAYGKVFTSVQIDDAGATPLQQQLSRLATTISQIGYITAGAIFIILTTKFFIQGGADLGTTSVVAHLLHYFMISVTLIVATVPEGLPMSVTLSLALSMRRMLKNKNLVRKMHACETMGAATVICTDKTGTLTQNKMTVAETQFPALGNGQNLDDAANPVAKILALDIAVNSTAELRHDNETGAETVIGNPTEGALLLWMHSKGMDYKRIRGEAEVMNQLTFSTERKYMATVVDNEPVTGKKLLIVKGAPEIVMGMCSTIAESADAPSDIAEAVPRIDRELKQYQAQAMRTLGFAYKILNDEEAANPYYDGRLHVHDLTFIGVVAISDPVREDVPDAVRKCRDAGIDVKIVTGDTEGTASEIARRIGVLGKEVTPGEVITGKEFEEMPEPEALEAVERLKVMCRARPMDKQRLVRLLQQRDEVVAVTGDGTNDAPALKAAHVGLSMGDGTSVAKEASDITILDNSFANITRAVMWGRSLYRNIQRFLIFQLSISFTACLIVFIGSIMGTDSPLTVTQMLYVNLIMDTFAAAAFASLPPNPDVMRETPRRAKASIITHPMWKWIMVVTVAFTAAITVMFITMRKDGTFSTYDSTLIFTTFIMLQFWSMWNAKAFLTRKSSLHGLRESRMFIAVAGIILVGLVLIVTYGGSMFNTAPISLCDWIKIFVLTSPVFIVGEMIRLIQRLAK